MVVETKARPFLLTGFKRSQFIFPLALHGSLNCLVLVVLVVGGEANCTSNIIWAGAYHCWLLWCRHCGGSRLYHLCFAQSQLFLLTGLTSYLLMLRIFDVRKAALHRQESLWHRWPQTLPPISPLGFKFKQLKRIVFVPFSLLFFFFFFFYMSTGHLFSVVFPY